MKDKIRKYNELVFLLVGLIEAIVLFKLYLAPYLRVYAYGVAFAFGILANYFTINSLFKSSTAWKVVLLNILPIFLAFFFIVLFSIEASVVLLLFLVGFFTFYQLLRIGVRLQLLVYSSIFIILAYTAFTLVAVPYINLNKKFTKNALPSTAAEWHGLVPVNSSVDVPIDFKGKITVVDFWATWCKPCIAQFGELELLQKKYRENSNVNIYALNTSYGGDSYDKVAHFMDKNRFKVPVLYDSSGVFSKSLHIDALPTTIIIDKKGVIRYKQVGLNQESDYNEEIISVIQQLEKEL